MNCLIVEDEPLAADVIGDYISQVPGMMLVGICDDVFSATEKMHHTQVDIIFLDINLPGINGLDFIRTLTVKPHIILTTAYHQYAIEGFNLNVTDYLLKPVEFSRFLLAVNKVFERTSLHSSQNEKTDRKHFYFTADRKKVKVFADEIIYIESFKDYIKIHTSDQAVITKMSISDMERTLSDLGFIRVHKSFIINTEMITAYNATDIELRNFKITIGRTYCDAVSRRLEQLNRI
ncbi:MAG: LytTR family DNA-binding domain-containing protein [Bacteroidota bacterium]